MSFVRPRFARSNHPLLRRDVLRGSKVHDFASIAAAANSTTTITVAGAAVGDDVIVTWGAAPPAGLRFTAWVSAADTVTLQAYNPTAGALDAASMTYKVLVFKP